METFDWPTINAVWNTAGIQFTPIRVADDLPAAERILETITGPAWVRGTKSSETMLTAVLNNPADLPLVLGQIRARTGSRALQIQQAVAGPQFRVFGYQSDGSFQPVEILRDDIPQGMYRVTMTRSTPPLLGGAETMRLFAHARRAARALPVRSGALAIEFVLTSDGPVVIWVDWRRHVDQADALLLRHAFGLDVDADVRRITHGQPPRPLPTRDMGAALAWLPTHGGDVSEITGVPEARDLPGVVDVTIRAQLGDRLGHVIDTDSRDAGGYVLAIGPTAATALERANAAQDLIEIHADAVRG